MFAVLNLGMKSIRLCLLDYNQNILYKKSFPLGTVIFGDCVEQDGIEWWDLTKRLFYSAESAGCKLEAIEAITVSASASCLVCVNHSGAPLRPIIMVSDRRHYSIVSNPGEAILMQRIRWIATNEPELFKATAYFLAPNDYLLYRLTGLAFTDALNAEKFGYDQQVGSYAYADDSVSGRLPVVRGIGEIVGCVSPAVAAELHIRPTVEVAISSYDAIVSVAGSGVSAEGEICDVSGTVTSVRMQIAKDKRHPGGAISTQRIDALDCYYLGGSNNLGGGLIEWLKTTFYEISDHVYDIIQSEAQSVRPSESGIVFLPYLLGERAPVWNPDARGVFFGIERMHSRKHFARSILEAAAFVGKSLIDEIVLVQGLSPETIRLSGGLSRLEICNRIKADVYGVPLEIVSEFESTVIGAYLLAFQHKLRLDSDERGRVQIRVKVRDVVLPDKEAGMIYQERFQSFKNIYKALEPIFSKYPRATTGEFKSEDGKLNNL